MDAKQWMDILRNSESVDLRLLPNHNRQIRRAISELRKRGVIFIPVGKFVYKRLTDDLMDEAQVYIRRETKHLATQYFNTVRPMVQFIQDERHRQLYGDLFKIMEELK